MNTKRFSARILYTSILALFVLSAFGQSREKREVSGVKELSISNAFAVEIRVGNTESLEIEIDEDYMQDVITEMRGGKLVIGLRDRGRRGYRMRDTPRAYLTVKSLSSIDASGAVTIKTLDVLKSDKLDINLSGASVLNLDLDVNELYLEASGACVISLEGRADDQTIRTTGATTYSAYDMESKVADIRVTGAGTAKVNVSDKLDVRASGASSVRYRGNPSVNSDSSGASSIRKG